MKKKQLEDKLLKKKSFHKKSWFISLIAIALFFSLSIISKLPVLSESLPTSQIHPLPNSLATWQDQQKLGDYFDLVETTPVGYLVWSQFPIKVYFEQSQTLQEQSAPEQTAQSVRAQQWEDAIRKAIAEWHKYLPLQIVTAPESADILIGRSEVSRKVKLNPETGLFDIPRTITAQTSYEFYLQAESEPSKSTQKLKPKRLAHRMSLKISPDLSAIATVSAARHELGHALGIWGHSDLESDALYFSQVRNTPKISPRDINTLKKIYQQPSKLGWQVSESAQKSFKNQ